MIYKTEQIIDRSTGKVVKTIITEIEPNPVEDPECPYFTIEEGWASGWEVGKSIEFDMEK